MAAKMFALLALLALCASTSTATHVPGHLPPVSGIGCYEPMHDAAYFFDELKHAVLHDATGICHGQLSFNSVTDVAATFGLTTSAMPLWCHFITDYNTNNNYHSCLTR